MQAIRAWGAGSYDLLVPGSILRRVELGVGEPAVVLEAGRNAAAASWRPVMSLLAPHVRVVAYDRAGVGGSAPAPPGPVTVERQAEDLASVIAGLNAGPCVLAGHSWGAILVQLLAFRRPDLAAGLVLVDPAHEQMADALPLLLRWGMRLARTGRRDELAGGDSAATAAALRELRAAPQPFPDVPVVVLSAARGLPHRFRARWTGFQAALAEAAPQGRHLVIDGAGHDIPADQPGQVAAVILKVVAQIRASSG